MRTFSIRVNGYPVTARYPEHVVDGVMLPILNALCALRKQKGRRVSMLLAAPPAAGKSTLALSMAKLSEESDLPFRAQALGMDGFHFTNAYLNTHTTRVNGIPTPLRARKGCPESFDVNALKDAVSRIGEDGLRFPHYDRVSHDVVLDHIPVTGEIIILEGNWLLLDRPVWRDIAAMADLRAYLYAPPEALRARQIARKMRGGLSHAEADRWYETVDGPNAELCNRAHVACEISLELVERDIQFTRVISRNP